MININITEFNKYKNDIFNLISYFNNSSKNNDSILDDLELFIKNNSAIVGGHIIDKQLVSFIWCYKRKFDGKDRLHISYFVVNEAYRGRGLSKDLLFFSKEKALENNLEKIDLNVNPDNYKAIEVYKNSGFKTEKLQLILDVNREDLN